ncbi:MAG: ParB N-terminal domain-containing protein [Candidatus Korarchaeota archaeon]|nr:ParB N-terminal domain-containing protein [Candidatus Korarchaeota archaeon]
MTLTSGDLSVDVSLVPIYSLRPHEMTIPARRRHLGREILEDGVLRIPVLVDRQTGALLDGHHRLAALRSLGARAVPAALVNYSSPEVEVRPRRLDVPVSKGLVRVTAASGRLLPPKTTRHVLPIDLPEVDVPLRDLLSLPRERDGI